MSGSEAAHAGCDSRKASANARRKATEGATWVSSECHPRGCGDSMAGRDSPAASPLDAGMRRSDEGGRSPGAEVEEGRRLRAFGAVLRNALGGAARLRRRRHVGPGRARHPRAGDAELAGRARLAALLRELLGRVRKVVQRRELLAHHQDGGEPEANGEAAQVLHGPRMILPEW